MKQLLIPIFLSLAALSESASAFPQMIAHGYASCVACHTTPSGGGLLSPYGRSLSREILSSFGAENEEKFLYGAVPLPEWFNAGGDIRVLQSYVNSDRFEQARFIPMQMDFEGGIITEKTQIVATVGYQNPNSANATGSKIFSRKHYLQAIPAEGHYVRAGKFEIAYGFRWPDHFIFSRRDLGWDEGSEAYRAEWVWQSGNFETMSSISMGRPETPSLQMDESVATRIAYSFAETNQAVLSLYYGSNVNGKRALMGPAIALNPVKDLMAFIQIDLQKMLGGVRGQAFGCVESIRLNYELLKGLHFYAMQEFSKLDLDASVSKQAYTLGVQWFSRPHIEIAGGVRKLQTSGSVSGATDSAWLLLHYYL
jgi:hypothetical protein